MPAMVFALTVKLFIPDPMGFFTYGNLKLPDYIAVFNFSSSTECPSLARGLCSIGKKCYSLKGERLRPNYLPFIAKQTELFDMLSASQFAKVFLLEIRGKKNPVKKFRFSVAGDVRNQADIDKFCSVAKIIKKAGIPVYGYTAASDLDFSKLKRHACICGQGFMISNHIKVVRKFTGTADVECPADCSICDACSVPAGYIIEILFH